MERKFCVRLFYPHQSFQYAKDTKKVKELAGTAARAGHKTMGQSKKAGQDEGRKQRNKTKIIKANKYNIIIVVPDRMTGEKIVLLTAREIW